MPKKQKVNLKWIVYYENFNGRRIEEFNIFDHRAFREDCKKATKKCGEDKEAFAEMIRRELMYNYWSKCEWEIVLTSLIHPENFKDTKIDVYDQVMLNWDIFIDYLWGNRDSL